MCPCAAIRRVGRGDDSGLLPGVDGWEQAHQPVRHREELSSEPAGLSVQGKRTEYPWPAPRTWRRSPAMRAGIARRDASGGLRGVSPQDDLPKASRAWGCPPPSPGGRVRFTCAHLSSYLHEPGHAAPQNFAPPRSWTGNSTHRPRIRSVSGLSGLHVGEGPSPMDVSSIATACTAISGVLVGLA